MDQRVRGVGVGGSVRIIIKLLLNRVLILQISQAKRFSYRRCQYLQQWH